MNHSKFNIAFNSILICLYFILSIIFLFAPENQKMIIYFFMALIGISSIFWGLLFGQKVKLIYKDIIFWLILILTFGLFQIINNRDADLVIVLISNICLAYFALSNKFNLKILNYAFAASQVFFIYKIFSLEGDTRFLFIGASRNWVSIVGITFASFVTIITIKQENKVPLLPSILCTITSIMAIGRSGIFASLFMLFFLFILNIREYIGRVNIFKILISTAIVLSFITWLYIKLTTSLEFTLFQRFTELGFDNSDRNILIHRYLSNINFYTFFLGYDVTRDSFYSSWDFNVHNSFLRLHYLFGIVAFVLLYFITKASIYLFKTNKSLLMILMALLIRSYSDIMFFGDRYDFILVMLVLIALKKSTSQNLYNKTQCTENLQPMKN